MSGIELKTFNPVVFDDLERCNTITETCPHLQFYYGDIDHCAEFGKDVHQRSMGSPIILKCQECKDHWRENKIIQCKGHLAHCSEIDHCKTCEESSELLKTLSKE